MKIVKESLEFLAINTKLPLMVILESKDFTTTKVTSSETQPENHCIRSLIFILLSSLVCACTSETLDPYIIIYY